ncbi:MAG: FAD-binding oxidoreductase [Planctomycetota bacterium]|jgi:FAD/FMN-containing dehydrogenase
MDTCSIAGLNGGTVVLDAEQIESYSSGLRGEIVFPGDGNYDEVRQIWNAMIDRKPGMIVRCAGAADVVRSVNFARENDLLVCVRGGGHNIAGNAVIDDAMMIDLSGLKSVRVDTENRTVRVEPGATLGDLDRETQTFGLAVPVGINSTTGVAGLTLGGGFGWLSRKYGMTVDNVIAADVVTANGKLLTANAENNSDLFWGIRGGGGNFGIVTSFEYRAREVGPEVYAGLIVHDFGDARGELDFYREFTANAPDELTVWAVLRDAPPLPFLPEEYHGKKVLVIALVHAGRPEEAEAIIEPLRNHGSPVGEHLGRMPFVDFQTAFDPLLAPGARNYWKSHNFSELSDSFIETVLEFAAALPTPHSEIFLGQLGGEQSRVAPDATAYWHRDAAFVMNVHTRWEEASDDDRCCDWTRSFFDAAAPFATGGVYVNFMPEDEATPSRIRAAFGGNWERLLALKKKYDPQNFFRKNQNIDPGK